MLSYPPLIVTVLEHVPFEYLELLISIFASVMASSSFWLYLSEKRKKRDSRDELLVGLAHDRIMELGKKALRKKSLTQDEYENLHDYLYCPYIAMGGNGTAKKIMAEVEKLPIRDRLTLEREQE